MAKLTKEELIAKINEKVSDSELAIELMEDITDSFGGEVEVTDEFKIKYEELLQRYKDRFVSPEIVEDIKDVEEKDEPAEIKEEEIIDVEEI